MLNRKISYFFAFAIIFTFACSMGKPDNIVVKLNSLNYDSEIEYYSHHNIMTDPGKFLYLCNELPFEINKLCEIVQGLLIHEAQTHLYGVNISNRRKEKELKIRKVEEMLDRIIELDDRELSIARPPQIRLVGNCRDFSVLLCLFLRHQRIPARTRVGYENYSNSQFRGDHWICEYYQVDQKRWIQVDAQLDPVQLRSFNLKFDPFDLPDNKFIYAGDAYKMCIANTANLDNFGVDYSIRGLGHIQGNLILDFLSLNKLEFLPWDHIKLVNGVRNSSHQISENHDVPSALINSNAFNFEDILDLYFRANNFHFNLEWKN